MAGNNSTRRLESEKDFEEAFERQTKLRIFKDDHIVSTGGVLVRFDDTTVVVQSGVGDIDYLPRRECEFFEMRRR